MNEIRLHGAFSFASASDDNQVFCELVGALLENDPTASRFVPALPEEARGRVTQCIEARDEDGLARLLKTLPGLAAFAVSQITGVPDLADRGPMYLSAWVYTANLSTMHGDVQRTLDEAIANAELRLREAVGLTLDA